VKVKVHNALGEYEFKKKQLAIAMGDSVDFDEEKACSA
jgi:hypothetical protein